MVLIVQYPLLLTMLVVNEDVLWLEPLFIDNNLTMTETTLSYQIASLSSSTSLNSSSIPFVATIMSQVHTNTNRLVILQWFVRIIGGLLIIVGGIGNTLSAFTLSRKKLRAQVTSIYLIALALSDLGI
mgnify:CR=1 FL=1